MRTINIGIIDADLLDRGTRHPNLALMKISGYMKNEGNDVTLLESYNDINHYEKVYLSKVFDFTKLPIDISEYDNLITGGTGLYWDKAEPLLPAIEHFMPDYNLYNDFISNELDRGIKPIHFNDYKHFSIGFSTRGCVRKCPFCINHNKSKVERWSAINEFYDKSKKCILLWDDNILAYSKWDEVFDELELINKSFSFRQGLDLRLLTKDKASRLANSKYHGDYIFAFDNINDKDIIIKKLQLWKSYSNRTTKLYVFCGFDREGIYDNAFWKQDIVDTFERIKILMKYKCNPYITRHVNYSNSPYIGTYINLARWCNQPSFYKKKSYREFCYANGDSSATVKYMKYYESECSDIAKLYYDIRYDDYM